jgi:hypothetical protein
MIPLLLLRVLWGEDYILIVWNCRIDSKFIYYCSLCVSINKAPDLNFVTFYCHIFLIFFSGFHEFGISLFAGLVDVEPKEAAMLPCIIAHHPCPHPPRSANMVDT